MLRNQRRTSPASASRCHPPHRGRARRAAQRRPYGRGWTELLPLSLIPKRTAAWFSRVNLPSPSGLSNSVAKRPILPQAKLPQLLNEPGRARRARRRVHLFPAVAPLHIRAGATSPHGFKESQCGAVGGPLARSPMRLKPCRQKNAFPGSPVDNPSVTFGDSSPYTGEPLGNDLSRR